MRSQCALYVDAGYVLAAAATRVTGTSLRSGITVDHRALVESLIGQAETTSQLPVLRVNWYDSGARRGGGPDDVQEALGMLPRVKLRLGRLNNYGEQKGVDVRLGLDLATHARNRVVELMFLVSGDDDLTEAVDEAQGHGVQVIVLAVPNAEGEPHGVSRHLHRVVDDVQLITPSFIDLAVVATQPTAAAGAPIETAPIATPRPPTPAVLARARLTSVKDDPAPSTAVPLGRTALVYSSVTGGASAATATELRSEGSGATDDQIDGVCHRVLAAWLSRASVEDQEQLGRSAPYIPADIDRALLLDLSNELGIDDLDEATRFRLRRRFWQHVGRQSPADPA